MVALNRHPIVKKKAQRSEISNLVAMCMKIKINCCVLDVQEYGGAEHVAQLSDLLHGRGAAG